MAAPDATHLLDQQLRRRLVEQLGLSEAGAVVRWCEGEARVRDAGTLALLARVVPRLRGGFHVDAAPGLGGTAHGERLAEVIDEADWRAVAGSTRWSLPFERGPGLYRIEEVDLAGIARRLLGPRDFRIAYLEAKCFGDCVFCGRVEHQSDGSAEALLLRASGAGEVDVTGAYVCIGGPEPTARRDVADFVRAFAQNGAEHVTMIATADPLADPKEASRLQRAGLRSISIPIYGATAAAHDAITRQLGSFSRVTRTLDALRDAGVQVYLHGLVLSQNQAELGAMDDWASRRELPLLLGLPRAKQKIDSDRYDPDPHALTPALSSARLFGVPPCLGGLELDGPEPGMLERWGPFVTYLAIQAGDHAAACDGCGARDRCVGLPRGLASRWATWLRGIGEAR